MNDGSNPADIAMTSAPRNDGDVTSTPTVGLETDRLRLDPLRPSHASEMVAVLGLPELYRYTGGTPPTLADLERRYAAQTVSRPSPAESWHNWIVRVPSDGAVGFVQATVIGEVGDVAWLIAVEAQGAGYAREAAAAMCAWLASVGVNELRAHIHPEHVASRRVAEAVGFVLTDVRDNDGEDIWVRQPPKASENIGTRHDVG